MFQESLIQAGLDYPQAVVYEALLSNGPQKAGKLAKTTPLKRGLVYHTLEELERIGLIKKDLSLGKVAVFEAEHPSKIKEFAEVETQKKQDAFLSFESTLPSIISQFNLVSGKPGVEFYEGEDGFEKILNDSLTATEEIYTYVDSDALDAHPITKKERDYVKKRIQKGIHKKILMVNSPHAREYMKNNTDTLTKIRLLPESIPQFAVATEIYNNKVSFLTFHEKTITGMLIHHPAIYTMQRSLFEKQWERGQTI